MAGRTGGLVSIFDHKPEDYGIRCSRCYVPYDCRKNFVNGKPTWFPACEHGTAFPQTVLKSEMYGKP